MKTAKHALTIGLLVVLGGTVALAGRTREPSPDTFAGTPVAVNVEAGGLLVPAYDLYIPVPTDIVDAAQF
jgi:hypothetical protein